VISFTKPVIATDMKVAISESFKNSSTEVKLYGSDDVMQVTTSYLMDDESDGADEKVRVALVDAIEKFSGLKHSANDAQLDAQHFTISKSHKVEATIADDIKNSAFKASIYSLIAIFIYILIRFKKWQFSTGAIIATAHDALFVIAALVSPTLLVCRLRLTRSLWPPSLRLLAIRLMTR